MKIGVTDEIMFIGDTHYPAEHRDYLAFLVAVRDTYGITTTLHVGDVVDNHALSYHESDPDLHSSGDELELVRKGLAAMAKEFPDLVISAGNHDALPTRKALTHGLPKEFLKGYNELFETPDTWKWVPDYVEFDLACGMPCVMQHAVAASLTAGQNKLRTASLIQGHHHYTAGVAWNKAPNWNLFFMSVGCGIDPEHPAFAYAGGGILKRPLLGCGVVIGGWASFIPMWLNDQGRWNGRVP